jgi:rRNA maturation endonuclease Nob1
MEKTIMGKCFDPDRYGMKYCPVCRGSGKLFSGVEGGVVCKICGGFGFVKKEKENNFDDHRSHS